MHIFSSLILILGALIVLVLGLASVLHDMFERGPLDSPLLQDNDLNWPQRYPIRAVPDQRPATDFGAVSKGGSG
jgi:hypothetical protein